ncbi:MAG: metal-dependent hydrolase [Candidatus Gastranaerophilaceae bacterium]
MTNYIKYLGHSAFYVKSGNYGLLFDPWLSNSSKVDFAFSKEKVTHILLSHAHGDHFGETIEISKSTGATIIAVFETANFCLNQGLNAIGVAMGSEIKFDFGTARFFGAIHSNSFPNGQYAGIAASILINVSGKKIFFAGDAALTKDFELIGELYKPEIAMLPIGGHFTMGIDEAVIASKMLGVDTVIPMHYNTFDAICADVSDFQSKILAIGRNCQVMNINDEMKI